MSYLNLPIALVRGKKPFQHGWREHTVTAQDIIDHPQAHYGIKLGPSTGLIDIEGDGINAEKVWSVLAAEDQLCGTLSWSSPRGRHRLFTVRPGQLPEGVTKIGDLEIRYSLQSVLPATEGQAPNGRTWDQDDGEIRLLLQDIPALPRSISDQIPQREEKPTEDAGDLDRPGDMYNQTNPWRELLVPLGWTFVGSNHVRRPGKTAGISGTIGVCATPRRPNCLYIFSTAPEVAPFAPNETYTPFEAYTLLKHDGNFSAASSELARNGFVADKGAVFVDETEEFEEDEEIEEEEPRERPTLDERFFDNLIGEYALRLRDEGEMECDPVAVYTQALIYWGALLRRDVTIKFGGFPIYPNDFLLVVGDSNRGRKGTAWNAAKAIFAPSPEVSDVFSDDLDITDRLENTIAGRINSAEGVQKVFLSRAAKDGTGSLDLTRPISLLFMDSEGSGAFKKTRVENSVLTDELIKIWDGTALSAALKQGVTHIRKPTGSIIWHIQPGTLLRSVDLDVLEQGLLNRFLFVFCERPFSRFNSPGLPPAVTEEYRRKTRDTLEKALQIGEMRMTPSAERYAQDLYEESKEDNAHRRNLFGREFTHILKIAILATSVKKLNTLNRSDLQLGKAVADYSRASAEYVLRDWLDGINPDHAEELAQFFRDASPGQRFTATDLRQKLLKSCSSGKVRAHLDRAVAAGLLKEHPIPQRRGKHYTAGLRLRGR